MQALQKIADEWGPTVTEFAGPLTKLARRPRRRSAHRAFLDVDINTWRSDPWLGRISVVGSGKGTASGRRRWARRPPKRIDVDVSNGAWRREDDGHAYSSWWGAVVDASGFRGACRANLRYGSWVRRWGVTARAWERDRAVQCFGSRRDERAGQRRGGRACHLSARVPGPGGQPHVRRGRLPRPRGPFGVRSL